MYQRGIEKDCHEVRDMKGFSCQQCLPLVKSSLDIQNMLPVENSKKIWDCLVWLILDMIY